MKLWFDKLLKIHLVFIVIEESNNMLSYEFEKKKKFKKPKSSRIKSF